MQSSDIDIQTFLENNKHNIVLPVQNEHACLYIVHGAEVDLDFTFANKHASSIINVMVLPWSEKSAHIRLHVRHNHSHCWSNVTLLALAQDKDTIWLEWTITIDKDHQVILNNQRSYLAKKQK